MEGNGMLMTRYFDLLRPGIHPRISFESWPELGEAYGVLGAEISPQKDQSGPPWASEIELCFCDRILKYYRNKDNNPIK